MSDPTSFDIYEFDASLLDIEGLLAAIDTHAEQASFRLDSWSITQVSASPQRRIYRASPEDRSQFPELAIKYSTHAPLVSAVNEQKVLEAFQDFGLSIAPRPFYASDNREIGEHVLVSEWLAGEALSKIPLSHDEETWHRIMSLLGIPNHMPFAKYANSISLRGTGPQSPGDMIERLQDALKSLDTAHPQYTKLAKLVELVKERVAPQWNHPPKITLNHLDPQLHHFIWDGHHLRLLGWDKADWVDAGYAVGQLSAHPFYEEVPSSHWVWYRWELARLTKDDHLTPSATLYSNLMQVFWAIELLKQIDPAIDNLQQHRLVKQQERYVKRAERAFPA